MFTSHQDENDVLEIVAAETIINKLSSRRRAIIALITAGYRQADVGKLLGMSRTSVGGIYRETLEYLLLSIGRTP